MIRDMPHPTQADTQLDTFPGDLGEGGDHLCGLFILIYLRNRGGWIWDLEEQGTEILDSGLSMKSIHSVFLASSIIY